MPDHISDKNDIPVRAAPLRFRLPTAHRSAATSSGLSWQRCFRPWTHSPSHSATGSRPPRPT